MTGPSFASRESTTLSIRWLQYGHFIRAPPPRHDRSAAARRPSATYPPGIRCRPKVVRSKGSLPGSSSRRNGRPGRRRRPSRLPPARGAPPRGRVLLPRQLPETPRPEPVPPGEEQAEDDRRNVDDDGVVE